MRNTDIAIIAVIAGVVLVVVLIQSREKYILPDVTEPNVCPDGFVLTCVSKELDGVIDTMPFPSSLPPPCEDTYTPLCLPGPQHTKPAYSKK